MSRARAFVRPEIAARLDAVGVKVKATAIDERPVRRVSDLVGCHVLEARWLLRRFVGFGDKSLAAVVEIAADLQERYLPAFEEMYGAPKIESSHIVWPTREGRWRLRWDEQLEYMLRLECDRLDRVDAAATRNLRLHGRLGENLREFAKLEGISVDDAPGNLERYRTVTRGKGDLEGLAVWGDPGDAEASTQAPTTPLNAPGGAA
ncbi:MAG TPA: hypothetical protein VFQ61_08540 [Polyangiaceae bacterium]|nr:hypothetical protein [Polyangiaceae bacterium]